VPNSTRDEKPNIEKGMLYANSIDRTGPHPGRHHARQRDRARSGGTGAARGLDVYEITPEQAAAVVGFLGALWAVIVPMVYAIRGQVYSPATVEQIKVELGADPAAAK
jgi:hypothetical protein